MKIWIDDCFKKFPDGFIRKKRNQIEFKVSEETLKILEEARGERLSLEDKNNIRKESKSRNFNKNQMELIEKIIEKF